MAPYLKAIVSAVSSGVIAFLSSLLTALQGEHVGFDTITAGQWISAALAFVVGLGISGGITYRVPNQPAPVPAPAAGAVPDVRSPIGS
jgi:hypothetical protein